MSTNYPTTLPPSVPGSHGAAHLADLVQCLGQELLVDAAEVGNLLLALMVHVHATVWGEGEAGPSEPLPQGAANRLQENRPPCPRPSPGQEGVEKAELWWGVCWVSCPYKKRI